MSQPDKRCGNIRTKPIPYTPRGLFSEDSSIRYIDPEDYDMIYQSAVRSSGYYPIDADGNGPALTDLKGRILQPQHGAPRYEP